MTYIELLNNFWDSTRFNPCSSNEAAMYFYLLHQCNIRRWINPFELKTRDLELTLGISRTTIAALRNKLKQRGFIDFAKGLGSGKAIYRMTGVKITDSTLNEKICVQSVDTMVDTTLDTMVDTTLNTKVDTNAKSTLYIEERRHKTKDDSVAVATRGAPQRIEPESLFAEEERKAAKKKSPPKPKITFEPPTLDEVRQYFLNQDADKRLENWEESARRFYYNYAAVGWIDKYNRRITRWDSKANSWIIDDEKREKERKQNEQTRTDRPIPPSGGIPIRGKVTPSCGLKRRDPSGET
jgi:hypothetical protein